MYEDILERSKMNDYELYKLYKEYCEKNNIRRDVKRAVKKFRDYCRLRLKE